MAESSSPTGASTPQSQSSSSETNHGRGAIEWETNKLRIRDLYMNENMNLNEVVERMKAHDFHAT